MVFQENNPVYPKNQHSRANMWFGKLFCEPIDNVAFSGKTTSQQLPNS